ncbi:MAG: hypothetical protein ACREJD_08065 [Phycisphaerales bacterium]
MQLQQCVDQTYTVQTAPGGIGNPNSLGYNVPTYVGLPSNPTEADIQEHAEMAAVATAIAWHWLGRHRGSGEFAGGQRSGALYIKNFGIQKTSPLISATPMQFHPSDAISATQPALIETLATTNESLTELANVGWNRFSPYNAHGVGDSFTWSSYYYSKLFDLCENFTLHPASGPTQICHAEYYVDDNENWLRDRHFSLVSFVHDQNKAGFYDYNAGDPTHLLGYTIPAYPGGVYVYRANIKNHILAADGVSELSRFGTEKIWSEMVGGTRVTRTLKDRWQRMIDAGIVNGTTPLPTSMSAALSNELNSLGREIQYEAIRRCNLDVAENFLGYRMKASQFSTIKGAAKFDEDGLYRHSNFGWDEQTLDLRLSQNGGTSRDDFDIAAGLVEVQRRIDLCDTSMPIRAWFRVGSASSNIAGFGGWEWMKAAWALCHSRGIYNLHFFLERSQDTTPLQNAWLEFRATLVSTTSIVATAPTFAGGAPVQILPIATGNPFANSAGDLMVRVTNSSGITVTASALAQLKIRPGDRFYPSEAVLDMSVTVDPGQTKSIGPIPKAFNDVTGNVRIVCSSTTNVKIEPYRLG